MHIEPIGYIIFCKTSVRNTKGSEVAATLRESYSVITLTLILSKLISLTTDN